MGSEALRNFHSMWLLWHLLKSKGLSTLLFSRDINKVIFFIIPVLAFVKRKKKKQQSGWDKYFWDIHLLCQLRLTWLTDSKGFTENWHLDTHKLQKLSVFMCEPGWFILEIRKRSENYMYSLAFPHLHTISANNGSVNNFQWYPTIHYQPKSEENETPIVFYLCMCSCFSPTILLCE